ncbi:hypothetical protein ACFLXE_06435 [Chloroflexota bacterium]
MEKDMDLPELVEISEKGYIELLEVLANMVESNESAYAEDTDKRGEYSKGLVTKFIYHALSLLYLSRNTFIFDFPSKPIKFMDHESMAVLARSAYETYLLFHYIFTSPKDEDERDFRYFLWVAAGYAERHSYTFDWRGHLNEKQEAEEGYKNCDSR